MSLPPAIAARFPDPPLRYNTPGLQDGRLAWSTADEINMWLRDLAAPPPVAAAPATNRRRSPAIKVAVLSLSPPSPQPPPASVNAGSSVAQATPGPRLQAVHLSTPQRTPAKAPTASETPAAAEPPLRPTVLLVGGRKASAATEALLHVARELTRGELRPLLARINVVVVPHAELSGLTDPSAPDDHVQLNTLSAQILAKLAQAQQVTVVLSAGEAPAMTTLGTQTALRAADVMVAHANHPNLPEFLTRAAEQWFEQPMLAALQAEALRADKDFFVEPAMPNDAHSPENIASAAALKNRIGLQVMTAGSDLGRAHVQRRVHAQVTAISSALTSTAKRAAELAELKPYIDREVTAQACRQLFVVDADAQPALQVIQTAPLLDPTTGADIPVPATSAAAKSSAPEAATRIKPCGYWLAEDAAELVERLRLHGVQVMRVAEPASLLGDSYRDAKPSEATGQTVPPDQAKAGRFKLVRGVIDAPVESFYVPVDQALGNLVVSTLEPDAPSSLSATLIDATAGMARIMTPPAIRLEALP